MHSAVSVIAGGWSFSQVPHDRVLGYVIAVNDSAYHLRRRPDEIVTMDRLWTEYRWGWLKQQAIKTHARRSAVQNIAERPTWLNVFECDNESVTFQDDGYGQSNHFAGYPDRLNGTNSGVCGLNRAWQVLSQVRPLKSRELFLFGFDMQPGPRGEKHWHPNYPYGYTTSPGKFKTWAREFDEIARQFRDIGATVWNVSDRSQIGVFPTLRVDELPRRAA